MIIFHSLYFLGAPHIPVYNLFTLQLLSNMELAALHEDTFDHIPDIKFYYSLLPPLHPDWAPQLTEIKRGF